MLDHHAANDRAVRYAIRTGEMPNIHLIHSIQGLEGFEPCFGRTESACPKTHCRWHGQCTALAAFSAGPQPDPVHGVKTGAYFGEELLPPQKMTVRGLDHATCGCG
jgi:hypothetical protein